MAAAVMARRRRAARHADISSSPVFAAGDRQPRLLSRARRRKPPSTRNAPRKKAAKADAAPKEEPISTALALDLLRVELGYGLLPLINDVKGHRITDQIKALRRQLAQRDGLRHAGGAHPRQHAAAGERVSHPRQGSGFRPRRAFPRPACSSWIPRACRSTFPARTRPSRPSACPRPGSTGTLREEAIVPRLHGRRSRHGADHASDRSAEDRTWRSCSPMPRPRSCSTICRRRQKKLVEELIPSQISVTGVQRVLQTLLAERVSIRDLPAILEGIAEAVGHTKNALLHHRACARAAGAPALPSPILSPRRLPAASSRCRPPGNRPSPNRSSARAKNASSPWRRRSFRHFIQTVRDRFDEASAGGLDAGAADQPADPPLRALDHRALPAADVVMSQNEIHPSVRLRTLGQI